MSVGFLFLLLIKGKRDCNNNTCKISEGKSGKKCYAMLTKGSGVFFIYSVDLNTIQKTIKWLNSCIRRTKNATVHYSAYIHLKQNQNPHIFAISGHI